MDDSLQRIIRRLQDNPQFARNVTAWRTLRGQPAQSAPWPGGLDPALQEAGRRFHIPALYTHQAAAVEAALRGDNVVVSTGTASGKTLGYVLPVLDRLMHDPEATALLLFPTKALAHDQIAEIERWIGALNAPIALRPYDGDTPKRHRPGIRKEARILVSNPDMLHLGILPHHTQWMRFFQGLRTVVLDELHTYRGVFGGHVANVLRRLRRIAAFYGAEPRCIAASATIANPRPLAEALWEAPFTGVADDGAAYGKRHVIFYNPPLLNPTLGLRARATDEALSLVARLLRADVQTIVFARSRLTVELLLTELRTQASRMGFDPEVIQGYRGGYLPQERRVIERDLRTGKVRVVVATNALELGIDIGALDASILVGYPGSIAATRQQMGRAGRRSGTSLSVLIATPSPLDQYLVAHPDYFFGGSPEQARVNPDALSLLASHLACASFELPFECEERFGKAQHVGDILEILSEEGMVHRSRDRFTWVADSYPAQTVSLRTATPDHVVVQAEGEGTIATVDRPSAPRMVHEGAVYFHGGAPYLIETLDWEDGIALAQAQALDYYTVASTRTQVERLSVLARDPEQEGAYARHTARTAESVLVHTQALAYRRVHLQTQETLGWGEIHLPEQEMETQAFRLTLGPAIVEALADEGVMVAPLDYGPKWDAVRQQALKRDGHRCRLCGREADHDHPLEVHHVTPLRSFMAQYARPVALKLAHAPENLMTLCSICHQKVERARGARTALSGLANLLSNLAPVFLMCDPGDLGTSVEARDAETGQPVVVVYDAVPGGVGLSTQLVELWPRLAEAALDRVQRCRCARGCPSCVGPVGESEPGAKRAAANLLARCTG